MAGEDITNPAPIPWWRQTIRYLGVCLVEAALAVLLLVAHFMVVLPMLSGNTSGSVACGFLGLVFLAPVFWLLSVIVFLAAKLLVVGLPIARRHWALAVYWGLALGVVAYGLVRPRPVEHSMHTHITGMLFLYGVAWVPAVVLTLSHFLLLPYVNPGSSARDVLRALFRRRSAPPASPGESPPQG